MPTALTNVLGRELQSLAQSANRTSQARILRNTAAEMYPALATPAANMKQACGIPFLPDAATWRDGLNPCPRVIDPRRYTDADWHPLGFVNRARMLQHRLSSRAATVPLRRRGEPGFDNL
ncbi:hypothetical protein [Streptomyces sp. NBC_00197]|uniref:hypothetical protein n=1 Tax=Streptomyces sp. NBC_00197 TaxID=2975676 RepID=UPI00324F2B80